ncbi:MAG: hypothetical protein PF513_06430 [Tenericutes bacterium]|jgi:hypothetical protein|nr:hypothetical protein [Mycoplasmatota bacterium]
MKKYFSILILVIFMIVTVSCTTLYNKDNSVFVIDLSDSIKDQAKEDDYSMTYEDLSKEDDKHYLFSNKMSLKRGLESEYLVYQIGKDNSYVHMNVGVNDSFETEINQLYIVYYNYGSGIKLRFSLTINYIEINMRTPKFLDKIETLSVNDFKIFLSQFADENTKTFLTIDDESDTLSDNIISDPVLEQYIQNMERNVSDGDLLTDDYTWLDVPPYLVGDFYYIFAIMEQQGVFRKIVYGDEDMILTLDVDEKYMAIKIDFQQIEQRYLIHKISYIYFIKSDLKNDSRPVYEVSYETNDEEMYFDDIDEIAIKFLEINLDEIDSVFESAGLNSVDE